ncbi:MAG: FHA domain-containing protein [Candidatus Binataceae bacterium]
MIKCSECGYENIDGLDYCDGCGAKLNAAVENTGASAAPSTAVEPAAPAEPAPSSEPAAHTANGEAAATPAPESASVEPAAPSSPSEAPTGEIHPPEAVSAPVAPSIPAPGEVAQFKAKLSILRGGRKGQEFELETGNNLVGRWDPETGSFPEVDLDQDDPEAKISRKHALIRIDGRKITIEDIGSLNGTYVNRQPRLGPGNPVEIKGGDEIIIGKTFLKLVVDPIS